MVKYIVTIRQGSDEIKFEFKDSLRANMFAEMALKGILPDTYYGSDEVKPIKITMEFVAVEDAPVSSEAPAAEDNTEKEEQ